MCLTLLHCLKKKCTKPILASILLSCLFNCCHEQSFWILPHWPHSLPSPVWLLPWNFILPDTLKHTSYLNPDVLIPPLESLKFHHFLMLLLTPSLPLLFVFWFGIQHIFIFFLTFNKVSQHSVCLCPFSFSFHTVHTILKLQHTQIFWAK